MVGRIATGEGGFIRSSHTEVLSFGPILLGAGVVGS